MEHDLDLFNLLKETECFGDLDDATLWSLQESMERKSFRPEEVVCEEGEPGHCMYIVGSGSVEVLKRGEDGAQVRVAVIRRGEIAGMMALFEEETRSATLRAVETATVWCIHQDAFNHLMQNTPELTRAMLAYLTRMVKRETFNVASLLSAEQDTRFKVAFFDAKPYTKRAFEAHNPHDYAYHFFDVRLSLETVALASGFPVVCAFVNDTLDGEVIEQLAAFGVRHVALRCAGYNNVDLDACEKHNVSVTHVPAYSPAAVAEHAAALMLALNRHIPLADKRVRELNFSLDGLVGFDMKGKTAGVVGAGKIGSAMLSILNGFGCRLLAYDKYPNESLMEQIPFEYVELDRLLAESDIVSLHAPLTPETHHMIDAAAVAGMKEGVMIVNTGRGALIDTKALIEGLKTGRIGAAGLDVYEEESEFFFEDRSAEILTDDELARLTTFNNVIVTGHQGFLTSEALAGIAATTVENIREYRDGRRGEQLTNGVCPKCG